MRRHALSTHSMIQDQEGDDFRLPGDGPAEPGLDLSLAPGVDSPNFQDFAAAQGEIAPQKIASLNRCRIGEAIEDGPTRIMSV